MAFCPECNATMGQTDIVCPDCGYDFPEKLAETGTGLAYFRLADSTLVVAAILTLLACVVIVLIVPWTLLAIFFNGDSWYWVVLIALPFHFVLCFAQYVVFVRVQSLK